MASSTLLTSEQARRNKNMTAVYNQPPHQKPGDGSGGCGGVNVVDDFRSSCLGLEGMDTMMMMKTNHLSNASSLVNSVESSREGSPDKNNNTTPPPVHFQSPPAANFYGNTTSSSVSNVNSWISSAAAAQLRCPVPVFAAWTDA